jgi:hypothetical protein
MRLIPEFLGHACLEPSLAKSQSRDVCIPGIQYDYTSCLVFSGISARYLPLGIIPLSYLIPASRDETFPGVLLSLIFRPVLTQRSILVTMDRSNWDYSQQHINIIKNFLKKKNGGLAV